MCMVVAVSDLSNFLANAKGECVDLEIPPPPELLPEYERLLRTAFGEELV